MLKITAHFILKVNGIQVQIQILGRKFTSCTTNIINHLSSLLWNRNWMMGSNVTLFMGFQLLLSDNSVSSTKQQNSENLPWQMRDVNKHETWEY